MKPLAVVVSGAPGSGKTTLAAELAYYMRLPHVERDTFKHSLELTSGQQVERRQSIEVYYRFTAHMLKNQMSFVTDGTLYAGASEKDINKYILSHSYTINVHARSQNEHQRFYDREMNRGRPKEWVKGFMKVLDEIYDKTVDPLDLGVPVIEVDTNDGFTPKIKEVAAKIEHLYIAQEQPTRRRLE